MKKLKSLLLATVFLFASAVHVSAQSVNVCNSTDYNCLNYYSTQTIQPTYQPQLQPVQTQFTSGKYPELCSVLSRTIYQGYTGNDVKRLQVVLGQEGLAYIGATGYYGPATRNAVKAFQARNGINTTGNVGPQTLARMRLLWCVGANYNSGGNTGYDYPGTQSGVMSIQPLNSSGNNVTIGWSSGGASSCSINGVPVAPVGQQVYTITSETNFTLNCLQGVYGNQSKTITVRPNQDLTSLPVINLSINPTTALVNTYATLYWSASNSSYCNLNSQNVSTSGSQQILITQNPVAYKLTCTGLNGLTTSSTVYSNNSTSNNTTTSANIYASVTNINSGSPVTLSWSSVNTNSCTVTGNSANFSGTNGSQVVYPTQTSAYTITCSSLYGGPQVTNLVTVYVNGSVGTPTVSISANPNNVTNNQNTTLTWTSSNASYCNISGGNVSLSNQAVNGTYTFAPTGSYTYTLTCYNSNSQSASATVYVSLNGTSTGSITVEASQTNISSGQSSVITWVSTNTITGTCQVRGNGVTLATSQLSSGSYTVTPSVSTTYTVICNTTSVGSQTVQNSITVNVNGTNNNITSSLTANNTSVNTNQPVVLTWSSSNATYCNLSGGGLNLVTQPTSGNYTVYPNANTIYSVTCYNSANQQSNTSQVNITVNGTSNVTATINASPNPVSNGQPVTLTWSSTNANYCNITANNSSIFTNQGTYGSQTVYPSIGTNYQITCYNYNGQNGATFVYVTTNGNTSVQPTATIYASTQNVYSGQSVNLNWYSSNANTCALYRDGNLLISNQNTSGSYLVSVTQTSTYQVTCTNNSNGQTANNYVTVTVNGSGTNGGISVISRQNGNVVISTTYCNIYGFIDWGDNTRSNLYPNSCANLSHQYLGTYGQSYAVKILDQNNNILSSTTLYPY